MIFSEKVSGFERDVAESEIPQGSKQAINIVRGRPDQHIHHLREDITMCANCGCGAPEATQGDDRNILWSQVVASADAAGISPQQAAENIKTMADQRA